MKCENMCVSLKLEQGMAEHTEALRTRINWPELRFTKHTFLKIFPFSFRTIIIQGRHEYSLLVTARRKARNFVAVLTNKLPLTRVLYVTANKDF
jgi:hypothetical protein